MRALRTPPDGYVRAGRVMLQGNRRLLVRLNVASLLLFLGAAVVFGFLGTLLRPDLLAFAVLVVGSPVLAVGVLILVPAMQVVLHEAVHGLAFWYFTGSRPVGQGPVSIGASKITNDRNTALPCYPAPALAILPSARLLYP